MAEGVGRGVRFGPRRLVQAARWVTIGVAALSALYLGCRFEFLSLPEEGCSPVSRYGAGCGLLVDRWVSDWEVGDCAFAQGVDGVVHLVILSGQNDAGCWWTASDVSECPGVVGEELGWLPEDRLVGRVVMGVGP